MWGDAFDSIEGLNPRLKLNGWLSCHMTGQVTDGRCFGGRQTATLRRTFGHIPRRKRSLPRVSPVAVRPGEGPFTERTTGIQAVRRERVLMPHSGRPPGCAGGSPTQVKRSSGSRYPSKSSDPSSRGGRAARPNKPTARMPSWGWLGDRVECKETGLSKIIGDSQLRFEARPSRVIYKPTGAGPTAVTIRRRDQVIWTSQPCLSRCERLMAEQKRKAGGSQ